MKQLILTLVILYTGTSLCAQNTVSFESAWEAVEHMRLGWNLGNTLDSNSGDTLYMWIEHWTDRMPAVYEKAWGQTVVKPELFRLFKEAGFNAIRVPVTWYPHMEAKFNFNTSSNSIWYPEWGTSTDKAYENYRNNLLDFARYFVEQTKQAGMGTFYWMCLSDGADRDTPVFTQPDLVDAIAKGYYGEGGYADVIQPVLVSSGRGFDKDNTCYDLKGCRITNSTEQSGIIIRNGKKVIRK